jgi:hypothetical protein
MHPAKSPAAKGAAKRARTLRQDADRLTPVRKDLNSAFEFIDKASGSSNKHWK